MVVLNWRSGGHFLKGTCTRRDIRSKSSCISNYRWSSANTNFTLEPQDKDTDSDYSTNEANYDGVHSIVIFMINMGGGMVSFLMNYRESGYLHYPTGANQRDTDWPPQSL
jgi:hypothetical protein